MPQIYNKYTRKNNFTKTFIMKIKFIIPNTYSSHNALTTHITPTNTWDKVFKSRLSKLLEEGYGSLKQTISLEVF